MKRSILLSLGLVSALTLTAQTLDVSLGAVKYSFPAAQAGEMIYSDGTTLTIMGRAFTVNEVTSMAIGSEPLKDNTVIINYNGSAATVTIAGNIAGYIDASVEGSYVTIDQSSEVGDGTCGEITYTLSGASEDACFTLNGSYKATVELNELHLACATGAPLNIQDNKRVKVKPLKGTTNSLVDCAGGSQKGCLVCKGHIEFKGSGVLTVTGNTAHAIYAKEYIELDGCDVQVLGAVKDGVNCNQYFALLDGSLSIASVGDDGVQVSFKDDTDREAEDTGSITISGGSLRAEVTAAACKALKADGSVTISGGDLVLSTSGGGKWDTEDVKTKAASCISADIDITISGGTLSLTSTGGGGKGISCDGNFLMTGGEVAIHTSGGVFAYINGTEYPNYTGNLDNVASDYRSSPKGIKADGTVVIEGGVIDVITSGYGAEGIESKSTLTINGGEVNVHAYDDGINSSSHMVINGGIVTVVSYKNDGLDSNGNLTINGGTVIACGGNSPECGLDANTEQGYTVYINGGNVLALGGGNSTPSSTSASAYVTGTSATAGTTVSLKSGSTELASFVVPSTYGSSSFNKGGGGGPGGGPGGMGSGMLVSCPDLVKGSSYTLTVGSTSSTVTAK